MTRYVPNVDAGNIPGTLSPPFSHCNPDCIALKLEEPPFRTAHAFVGRYQGILSFSQHFYIGFVAGLGRPYRVPDGCPDELRGRDPLSVRGALDHESRVAVEL